MKASAARSRATDRAQAPLEKNYCRAEHCFTEFV
jgi:hypothetical protein